MRTKFIKQYNNIFIVLVVFLSACSDKYVALVNADKAPTIVTNKQAMIIRERDYSNAFPMAGFLSISAKDTLTSPFFITLSDSTGKLEFFYDSLPVTGKLPINQPTNIYVACKTIGTYTARISIYDRFANFYEKEIPVVVIPDTIPIAKLNLKQVYSAPGMIEYLLDASGCNSRISRITDYQFEIDNSVYKTKNSTIQQIFYSGTHVIKIICYDDLGMASAQVIDTITIP